MTPRVLHLLSCDDWGGTEVQVATCVAHTDPRRCVQHLATLDPSGPVTERLAGAGFPTASLAGRFGPAGAAGRLARLLRRWRIDVLEVYGFRAGLVARAAAPLGGRPMIVIGVRGPHFVDAPVTSARARLALAAERALSPTAAAYVANSEGAAEGLRRHGFPAGKLRVIPNGVVIPPAAEAVAPNGPLRVACVARFTPSKRHDVILHALRRLADAGTEIRCVLVGDGETRRATRSLAATLGIADRVHFTGRLTPEAVHDELAASDAFVLASEREGMPGSVLEAMAHGLAVVASDVEGTREIVEHDVTGLLVPAGDPSALSRVLARLAFEPDLRLRLGRAGREAVRTRFGVERLAERRVDLYEELRRSRGSRGRRR